MGERVVLRDMGPADVEPFVRAFADDPELVVALGHDEAPRPAEVRAMVKRGRHQREDGLRVQLTIAERVGEAFAGQLVLHRFDWSHRRAEIGFFVVRAARRRGVALDAVSMATQWAFATLRIHRVQLVTNPQNEPTQRLAERAGFAREGVLRDYTFERGRFVDNVVFSCLAPEGAP